MSKYYVTDTELTSVADAIRTKGGTSADLEFPTGFVTAIGNISGGGSPNLQAKTNISPTTSSQTITADEGYDGLSSVQINALDGQAAQTIHPSTSDQTIASGKYLTGAQTVKGVLLTNLDAGNIKKDVVVKVGDSTDDDCVTSVTGTYEGGGGSYEIVGGTVTLTNAASTIDVSVSFDPQYAVIHTDPYNTAQTTAWKLYISYINRVDSFAESQLVRYNNGAYASTNGAMSSTKLGTYSNGTFTFPQLSNYTYPGGCTYTWFCWRARS